MSIVAAENRHLADAGRVSRQRIGRTQVAALHEGRSPIRRQPRPARSIARMSSTDTDWLGASGTRGVGLKA